MPCLLNFETGKGMSRRVPDPFWLIQYLKVVSLAEYCIGGEISG